MKQLRLDRKAEQRARQQFRIPRYFDIVRSTKDEVGEYEGVKVGYGKHERILYGFQTNIGTWWKIVRKPVMRCPACQLHTSLEVPNLEFRRFDHHEHTWMFYTGIQCKKCGYLIRVKKSEQYYRQKV